MVLQKLEALGKDRSVCKGGYLFRQGDKSGNFYFVQQGLIKAFYETLEAKQFIKSFISEGGFIGSMQAIVDNQPCSFSAIALEECKIMEVPRAALHKAIEGDVNLLQPLNAILVKLASKKERREYELLCLSPEERYLSFCRTEPALIARLSQEDIARYLGVTPVSLSRIRKRCGLI